MKLGWALLAAALLLSACGAQAAPPQVQTPTQATGPAPAPTDVPTQTPVPTDTPVPTNTIPPTPTRPPDTPTPLPTNTNTPVPTATPTRTPVPGYPPNAYERLSSLRSYRMQFDVSAEGLDYNVHVDEATPNYHASLTTPLGPIDLYYVNHHYISGSNGTFVDSGTNPPPEAAAIEAVEQFARGWFDHPDSAFYKGSETVNGVRANHFVLTWKAGRPVSLGAISSTTYDPTTGDVWVEAAGGAIVKASFSMRVNNGGGVSTVVSHMDLTSINAPLAITPPPVQKASASA